MRVTITSEAESTKSPAWARCTFPYDVNENGDVVGQLWGDGDSRVFDWANGTMTELPGLWGTWGWPVHINDAGQIVGMSLTSTGERHAFLWAQGAGIGVSRKPALPARGPRK